jgi:carboxylesterase type B
VPAQQVHRGVAHGCQQQRDRQQLQRDRGRRLLPDQARALYDRGDIAKVPYILGSNTDEGTLFTTSLRNVTTDDAYRAVISQRVGEQATDTVLQRYPVREFKDEPQPYQAALARVFGDQTRVCSTYDSALRAARAGAPTWMYNFDIPANVGGLGATHGSELVYVFDTSPNLSDDQKRASERIQGYWTNLAKQADPNGGELPKWPAFSADNDVRMNLGLELEVVEKFRTSECDLWRSLYEASYNAGK